MNESQVNQKTGVSGKPVERVSPAAFAQHTKPAKRKSISMHENVGPWCDCCTCEAEPYWLEVAEELGIDLDSDYEDDQDNA